MEGLFLTGLASAREQAKLTLRSLPPTMDVMTRIMTALADEGISVDMMSHADRADGRRQMQLTMNESDLETGLQICRSLLDELGGEGVDVRPGLTKVTLVGSGMTGMPGVYARALQALLRAGVEVHALGTSSVSISFVVDADMEDRTLQALHEAFDLAKVGG